MRKLLACILLLALAISLFGCSKQEENLTIEEKISKLTLEDVEPFLESYDGIIWDDMHLIDKNWFQRFIASSASRQDAIDICTREIEEMGGEEDTYVVTDCQVIYESDLFYGLEVHYEHHQGKACREHKVKVISLKKEVADRNADGTAYKIYADREEVIKQAVLYAYFDKFLGNTVLSCNVERGEKDSVVTIYAYHPYGTWTVVEHYFQKQTVVVDNATGEVTIQEPTNIKVIEEYLENRDSDIA